MLCPTLLARPRHASIYVNILAPTNVSPNILASINSLQSSTEVSRVYLRVKKAKLVRAKQCPYCTGIGNLMCASCCGSGKNAMDSTSSTATQCQCATCSGQGSISCQNCMGRGQFIPTILDVTVSRDPESAYEAIGLQ
ncbi:hypothetical protein M885DRAFT_122181 [Pelagophyceae sp. CCMP2097]|nr:hypothetical protein M885DRAFT_122181 [Pelagophyceae sp. CCMP2097]